MKKIIILFIFLHIIFLSCSKNKMEIYAIKYGESTYSSKYIFYNDKLNKELIFAWLFYLVKYDDKIILIDTGFNDEKLIKLYKIQYKSPILLLKELNIEPDDVTDVILTHSHFDHIGCVDQFKNANIYIQEDELKSFLKTKYFTKLTAFLEDNKKIVIFKEEYTLYDKFLIKKIGGHSIGSSIIIFKNNSKEYIFTGDECYINDNIKNNIPVGTYYNIENNKKFLEKYNNDKYILLLFHDPEIIKNKFGYKKIIP